MEFIARYQRAVSRPFKRGRQLRTLFRGKLWRKTIGEGLRPEFAQIVVKVLEDRNEVKDRRDAHFDSADLETSGCPSPGRVIVAGDVEPCEIGGQIERGQMRST